MKSKMSFLICLNYFLLVLYRPECKFHLDDRMVNAERQDQRAEGHRFNPQRSDAQRMIVLAPSLNVQYLIRSCDISL